MRAAAADACQRRRPEWTARRRQSRPVASDTPLEPAHCAVYHTHRPVLTICTITHRLSQRLALVGADWGPKAKNRGRRLRLHGSRDRWTPRMVNCNHTSIQHGCGDIKPQTLDTCKWQSTNGRACAHTTSD